jgi:hypothetical protein
MHFIDTLRFVCSSPYTANIFLNTLNWLVNVVVVVYFLWGGDWVPMCYLDGFEAPEVYLIFWRMANLIYVLLDTINETVYRCQFSSVSRSFVRQQWQLCKPTDSHEDEEVTRWLMILPASNTVTNPTATARRDTLWPVEPLVPWHSNEHQLRINSVETRRTGITF